MKNSPVGPRIYLQLNRLVGKGNACSFHDNGLSPVQFSNLTSLNQMFYVKLNCETPIVKYVCFSIFLNRNYMHGEHFPGENVRTWIRNNQDLTILNFYTGSLCKSSMVSTKYSPHFVIKMQVAILVCEIGSVPSFYCNRVFLVMGNGKRGGVTNGNCLSRSMPSETFPPVFSCLS
jgi:hypothetical protein